MELGFRIGPDVPEDACPLGYLKSPSITPGNSIVMYNFAGAYIDNISTYPDQNKVITSRKLTGSYAIGPLYSSNFFITNKVYARRNAKRSLPLFKQYVAKKYVVSTNAYWDGAKVIGLSTLYQDVDIINAKGQAASDIVYDLEFKAVAETDPTAAVNLFVCTLLMQGKKQDSYYKIRYRAFDQNNSLEIPGHVEIVSSASRHNLYNINLEFKSGYGADLLGQNYPGSRKSPKNKFISAGVGGSPWDQDLGSRDELDYSLIYNYKSNAYECRLSVANAEPATPCILFYNDTNRDQTPIVSVGNGIITLVSGSSGNKQYKIAYLGKNTKQVVSEINETIPALTAVEVLRIEDLKDQDFDFRTGYRTSDGGHTLHSNKFIVFYPGVPRIHLLPPYEASTERPWMPRVRMGAFVNTESADKTPYYINQFFSQAWSGILGAPWKDVTGETPRLMTPKIIKSNRYPLHQEKNSIILYDVNGRVRSSYIEAIDAESGLIFLNTDINERDYFITYAYKESGIEIESYNLNPAKPFLANQNSFFHVYLRPFINAAGVQNKNSLYVQERQQLEAPDPDAEDVLLGVYRIVDPSDKEGYQFVKTPIVGGGLSPDIPDDELRSKFAEKDFSTDIGNYDGIPYPGNAVVVIDIPAAVSGEESFLTEDYTPSQNIPTMVRVYNAINVPVSTKLRIVKPGKEESVTVKANVSNSVLEINTPLSEYYPAGSRVILERPIDPLYDSTEVMKKIRKHVPSGTYTFLEKYGSEVQGNT